MSSCREYCTNRYHLTLEAQLLNMYLTKVSVDVNCCGKVINKITFITL